MADPDPNSYMIVHLTCPLSKESYPVVKKSIRLADLASKVGGEPQTMRLYKDEIQRTRKLYSDKRNFKGFSSNEKDPVLQSINDLLSGDEVIVFPNEETKGGRVFMGGAISGDGRALTFNAISPKITYLYKGKGVSTDEEDTPATMVTPEELEAAINERVHQQLPENTATQLGQNWPAKNAKIRAFIAQRKANGGSLEDIRKVYEEHPDLAPGMTLATRGGVIKRIIESADPAHSWSRQFINGEWKFVPPPGWAGQHDAYAEKNIKQNPRSLFNRPEHKMPEIATVDAPSAAPVVPPVEGAGISKKKAPTVNLQDLVATL